MRTATSGTSGGSRGTATPPMGAPTGIASTSRPYFVSAALLDQASLRKYFNALTIRPPIERDGNSRSAASTPIARTGDRHPFGVAGQLKLGSGGPQLFEARSAVAEDVDLALLQRGRGLVPPSAGFRSRPGMLVSVRSYRARRRWCSAHRR